MDLLRRIRWGNVARAIALLAAVGLVVAWPRLSAPPPELPPAPRLATPGWAEPPAPERAPGRRAKHARRAGPDRGRDRAPRREVGRLAPVGRERRDPVPRPAPAGSPRARPATVRRPTTPGGTAPAPAVPAPPLAAPAPAAPTPAAPTAPAPPPRAGAEFSFEA